MRYYLLLLQFIVPIIYLLLDKAQSVALVPYFYLSLFFLSNLLIFWREDKFRYLFSPSSVMINYVLFTFTLGPYWLLNGWYTLTVNNLAGFYKDYYLFKSFEYFQAANSFFMFCIPVCLLSLLITSSRRASGFPDKPVQVRKYESYRVWLYLACGVGTFIIFSQIHFSIPGYTSSNLSFLIEVASALTVVFCLVQIRNPVRFLAALSFFTFFVVFEYDNKRLAVFLVIVATMLELLHYKSRKWNLRLLFGGSLVGVGIFASILAMSILRGYGSFGVTSPMDAFRIIPVYVQSDRFLLSVSENLELVASYFHSLQAVNHVFLTEAYTYGSTLLNAFSVVVPRSIFPNKPLSVIELYTQFYYPAFAARGGSYPPNLFAEMCWNFGYIGGLLGVFLIFIGFNHIFFNFVAKVRSSVGSIDLWMLLVFGGYYYLLMLMRGSGWDLLAVNMIFYGITVLGFSGFVWLLLLPISSLTPISRPDPI